MQADQDEVMTQVTDDSWTTEEYNDVIFGDFDYVAPFMHAAPTWLQPPQLFSFDEEMDGTWQPENEEQQRTGGVSITYWRNGSVSMRRSFGRVNRPPLQNVSQTDLLTRSAPSSVVYWNHVVAAAEPPTGQTQ